MDFDKIFVGTSTASKQLEARWFFDEDKDGNITKKPMHCMPFQRRNLSYWRGVQYKGKKRRRRRTKKVPEGEVKKMDILYSQWKHRVRSYNDAFLSSPRRATRNFKTSNLEDEQSSVVVVEAMSPGKEKQKASLLTTAKMIDAESANNNKEDDAKEEESTIPSESVALLVSETDEDNSHREKAQLDDLDEDSSIVVWANKGQKLDPNCTKVVFHLLYVEPETQEICIQAEIPDGRRCPFCYFDGGTDAGLLMHCVTCHTRLSFESARSEDGTLHVKVTKLRSPVHYAHDFCYVRAARRQNNNTTDDLVPSVPFVKRQLCRAGALDLPTRRKKIKLLMEVGADEANMKQFECTSEVPVRQYFHSRANEPMLEGEWDVDSDDEEDEGWLTKMSEELLDEFDDVTLTEKKFTKIWNRFMKSHTVIADRDIPSKCFDFVRTRGQLLNQVKLRQEVLLHFTGFWDAGLISSTHLMELMIELDKLVAEDTPAATGATNGAASNVATAGAAVAATTNGTTTNGEAKSA